MGPLLFDNISTELTQTDIYIDTFTIFHGNKWEKSIISSDQSHTRTKLRRIFLVFAICCLGLTLGVVFHNEYHPNFSSYLCKQSSWSFSTQSLTQNFRDDVVDFFVKKLQIYSSYTGHMHRGCDKTQFFEFRAVHQDLHSLI